MGACFGKKGFNAELDGEAALDKKSSKTGHHSSPPNMASFNFKLADGNSLPGVGLGVFMME
eukprot:COSAG05_NODE_5664_length_1119_cov_3.560784_2_plen_60_part_01